MSRKLRIGWSSNAPWGTSGYATQSELIVSRMIKAGFPVAFNAFAGFFAGFLGRKQDKFRLAGDWENVPIYPTLDHLYGSDGLYRNLQNDFNADIIIPFQDIHTLTPQDIQRVKRLVPYVPIDRDPVPQAVLNPLGMAWRIITYSQWGHDVLLKSNYHSTCILHGVDTQAFKPVNKKEVKRMFGLDENVFVVGMVAANKENPPRKGFQQAVDAFAEFLKVNPNSVFWVHSWIEQPGGFNVKDYANFLGIGNKIRFMDHLDMVYMGQKDMNNLYNMFDVLLMPSFSEGFGLPAIEAQSAGTPVIVNDATSLSELVIDGKTGYLAKPRAKRYDPFQSYVFDADEKEIYKSLVSFYNADRDAMSKESRKYMESKYDIDLIFRNNWMPFLDKIEIEIYGAKPAIEELSNDPNDPVIEALKKTTKELGDDKILIA